MNVVLYNKNYELNESLENFLDTYFGRQMNYLASDLLDEGLSPIEIAEAVRRAMTIGKVAEIAIRRHFIPVYTFYEGTLVRDCKLSNLGYAMVLLNAAPTTPAVAAWQMKVLGKFFEK